MSDQGINRLMHEIVAELGRARQKFPGDNVTTLALVEEVGELAQATFEKPRAEVRKEAIQVACMAMCVVLDGDATLDSWRAQKGLDPLVEPPPMGAKRQVTASPAIAVEPPDTNGAHAAKPTAPPARFIRVDEVEHLTGLGRSYFYKLVAKGAFPAPFRIGSRAAGWSVTEVEEWIATRPRNDAPEVLIVPPLKRRKEAAAAAAPPSRPKKRRPVRNRPLAIPAAQETLP